MHTNTFWCCYLRGDTLARTSPANADAPPPLLEPLFLTADSADAIEDDPDRSSGVAPPPRRLVKISCRIDEEADETSADLQPITGASSAVNGDQAGYIVIRGISISISISRGGVAGEVDQTGTAHFC